MRNFFRIALLLAGLLLFGWFLHRAGPRRFFPPSPSWDGWPRWCCFRFAGSTLRTRWAGICVWTRAATRAGILAVGQDPLGRRGSEQRCSFRLHWWEALKVHLLTKHGVPGVNGAASVVTRQDGPDRRPTFFLARRFGAAATDSGRILRAARGCAWNRCYHAGVGRPVLPSAARLFPGSARDRDAPCSDSCAGGSKEKLREIDDRILQFYRESRRHFLLSVGAYLAGWLLGAVEVAAIACWLGAHSLDARDGIGSVRWGWEDLRRGGSGCARVQRQAFWSSAARLGLRMPLPWTTRFSVGGREVVFALIGGLTIYFEELTLKDLRREISVTGQK